MTETERLALTAAFLTAVIVAGLTLSLIPHFELVTIVVFASGILLGSRQGALVGAVGMPLYVFANSAVRGFPPSPLPVLAAQAVGMALPGMVGGWWRGFWLDSGAPRRIAFAVLPVLGVVLAGCNQVILNFASVMIMSEEEGPRTGLFLSGMAFGLLDMVWNGVVFAVGGPPAASAIRRLARARGWWGRRETVLGVGFLLLAGSSGFAGAAPRQANPAGPDSILAAPPVPAVADTATTRETTPARTTAPRPELRTLTLRPAPLWKPVGSSRASVLGAPGFLNADPVGAAEYARLVPPAVPTTFDRWAMGWGRVRFTYDGLPLRGRVHGFDEPPDIPLAWRGTWHRKWQATGTSIDIPAADPPEGAPLSQISLVTASLATRSAEFALFRNLGPVNVGLDFTDREGQGRLGIDEVTKIKHDRLWVRLTPVKGTRPAWTLDLSVANETRFLDNSDVYFGGAEMGRDARRVQGSLLGPFLGGETRLAAQYRRHALQTANIFSDFGEARFDGYTVQADWAAALVPGLNLRARWEKDRRRGVLAEDRSFYGYYLDGSWSARRGNMAVGADAAIGDQEPYGFTWEGAVMGEMESDGWAARVAVSHEEDLPSMVIGLDRPTPVSGMGDHLNDFEQVEEPETRTAVRVEGAYSADALVVTLGGWAARQNHYRVDNNPVWTARSVYSPIVTPGVEADVLGAYGEATINFTHGFYGTGKGRVHDRDKYEIPYLASWLVEGALHWRREWVKGSILLDASVGGTVVGSRRNPETAEFPATALGFLELLGRVDNGVVTFRIENLADTFMESDLRREDLVTPVSVAGLTVQVGLTMYLTN
jgi:hypothetical protein